MSPIGTGIGATIREMRIERGVEQTELARKAKCHRSHIVKIERGDRNPSEVLLHRIARALDIKVDELRQPTGAAA